MIIRVTLVGLTPLIVHSQRGMNPTDPKVIELAGLVKREKTPSILKQISDLELSLSLYYDTVVGPYIPASNVRKMLHDGAKKTKKGPKLLEAVRTHPNCQMFPIIYKGERGMEWLMEQPEFRDVRNVRVGKAYVTRTRGLFGNWKLQGDFIVDGDVMKFHEFKNAGEAAGNGVGLCDYSPKRGGEYGTFEFGAEIISE